MPFDSFAFHAYSMHFKLQIAMTKTTVVRTLTRVLNCLLEALEVSRDKSQTLQERQKLTFYQVKWIFVVLDRR